MHHSRRKSGHGLGNTSSTDVRKAAKQSSTSSSRRNGSSQSGSKSSKTSSREAPKDYDEDYYSWGEEWESLPQYCMTCEKQFVAKDDRLLYCSEACRNYDQEYGSNISTRHYRDSYLSSKAHSSYSMDRPEPRDIIPRASPSRPSSTYFSPPPTPAKTSSTLPTTSSAMAALRQLSLRDASPPSPTLHTSSSGIWPFSSSRTAASPSASSYTRTAGAGYSSTYDTGYHRTGGSNYHYGSSDRPLPSRRPGSHGRPKSIELVAPLIEQ